jgi:hypothetical protein
MTNKFKEFWKGEDVEKMAMSRKDYVNIGNKLRDLKNIDADEKGMVHIDHVISAVGSAFKQDNPNYDHQRFIDHVNKK